MRPVLRGMCKYETIRDPNYSLVDFARMNEAIDVELINSTPPTKD